MDQRQTYCKIIQHCHQRKKLLRTIFINHNDTTRNANSVILQRLLLYRTNCTDSMEFFQNGAELSLNSVNSANSGNLINHWSMNWAQFKNPVYHMCLAGAVVASWPLIQEEAGLSPFTVRTNIFVTEFGETYRENSNLKHNKVNVISVSSYFLLMTVYVKWVLYKNFGLLILSTLVICFVNKLSK